MEKGFFFYQLPNSDVFSGVKGVWNKVPTITACQNGYLVTSFDKKEVFNMTEYTAISISDKFEIKRGEASEFHYPSELEYKSLIEKAIHFCQGKQGKVVVSRIKRASLRKEVEVLSLFKEICAQYKHSFNYLSYIPGKGVWIGASPEQLLVGESPGFQIASLAGSRKASDRVPWTAKEYQEQQLVTDTIEDVLNQLKLKYAKSEVVTVQAGNVEHLKTEFNTLDCNEPLLLADRLHPTPAISGLPVNEALTFIEDNEFNKRDFYAGVVGFFDAAKYNLYVNLRSARVYQDCIDVYIGGGITAESNPQKEWDETEFKSQTLLSIVEKLQKLAL